MKINLEKLMQKKKKKKKAPSFLSIIFLDFVGQIVLITFVIVGLMIYLYVQS